MLIISKIQYFNTVKDIKYGFVRQKIRECRESKNLSQKDLAGILTTSYSVIGKYERDEMIPSIDVTKNITKILGTTLRLSFGRDGRSKYLLKILQCSTVLTISKKLM